VLFLFVIMLLNVEDEGAFSEKKDFRKIVAFVLAGSIFAELMAALGISAHGTPTPAAAGMAELGTVESVGKHLFTEFLFPFEVVSLLLVAAMVGVIVLAKRKEPSA
jgi:NADH-quinone oxidoreductase subunit J